MWCIGFSSRSTQYYGLHAVSSAVILISGIYCLSALGFRSLWWQQCSFAEDRSTRLVVGLCGNLSGKAELLLDQLLDQAWEQWCQAFLQWYLQGYGTTTRLAVRLGSGVCRCGDAKQACGCLSKEVRLLWTSCWARHRCMWVQQGQALSLLTEILQSILHASPHVVL